MCTVSSDCMFWLGLVLVIKHEKRKREKFYFFMGFSSDMIFFMLQIKKFSTKILCYFENIKNFPAKYNFKKVVIEPILKKEIYNLKKNLIKQNRRNKN